MDEASAQAALTRVWQLHDQGQYRLAIDKLNQLLRREVLPPTVLWRAYELYGSCQYDLGELGKAAELWWQAICRCQGQHLWDQRKLLSNYLFMLHYLDGISDELLRERHFLYGRLCAGIRRFPQIRGQQQLFFLGHSAIPQSCFRLRFLTGLPQSVAGSRTRPSETRRRPATSAQAQ